MNTTASRLLVFASARAGSGTTTAAALLALAAAAEHRRTTLVDADESAASFATLLELPAPEGVTVDHVIDPWLTYRSRALRPRPSAAEARDLVLRLQARAAPGDIIVLDAGATLDIALATAPLARLVMVTLGDLDAASCAATYALIKTLRDARSRDPRTNPDDPAPQLRLLVVRHDDRVAHALHNRLAEALVLFGGAPVDLLGAIPHDPGVGRLALRDVDKPGRMLGAARALFAELRDTLDQTPLDPMTSPLLQAAP